MKKPPAKKKLGRPRRDGGIGDRVTVTLSAEEGAVIRQAAWLKRVTMAEYFRRKALPPARKEVAASA